MKKLLKTKGFTLIETMISSVIIALVILAAVNLLTVTYKGITDSQLKTYSMNMVSEAIDFIKQEDYSAVKVTPDSCLPYPLTNLDAANCPSNPYPVEETAVGTRTFRIYKVVQYAEEDASGNIVAVAESELGSGSDKNIKMITVSVAYQDKGNLKTTSVSSIITNKNVPMAGSSVSGTISKLMPSGTPVIPGAGSNATVHFVGYPQYTTRQNSGDGDYTVQNVMPGSYIIYATGIGFDTTYYASNPLVVPEIPTAVVDINFSCVAIDGASVSGNVYIDVPITPSVTPTLSPTVEATPTNTIECGTKILYAIGSMTGKSALQQWNNIENITSQDGSAADSTAATNRNLYTSYEDYTESNCVISNVTLYNRITSASLLFSVNNALRVYLTSNDGTAWNNTTSGPDAWSNASPTTIYASLNSPNVWSWATRSTDLTALYTTWDWGKINTLGTCIRSNTGTRIYLDASWLQVEYCVVPPTPTPENTATYTHTPDVTPTETQIPCADQAIVRSLDGLSTQATVSVCSYLIQNINPSLSETSVSSTFAYGGKTYYKLMTGVPVSAGTTSFVDIYLEETTGTPTINGFVYDSVSMNGIIGATVFLTDPMAVSPTTTGGGAYTIFPAATGSWVLSAAAAGYKIQDTVNITVSAGLQDASNILMVPIGNISGRITDSVTGNPVASVQVNIKNSANTLIGSGYSDPDGNYIVTDLPTATSYKVEVNLGTTYDCTLPNVNGQYLNVPVTQGVTTPNKDFSIRAKYKNITGKVVIDGADIKEGVVIMAYPSASSLPAHNYKVDSTVNTMKAYTGRARLINPYYGSIAQRDATYTISVPVGSNYDVYAYYSYISYTGSVANPVKTLRKYFKAITNIAPDTADNFISGNLSTWSSY